MDKIKHSIPVEMIRYMQELVTCSYVKNCRTQRTTVLLLSKQLPSLYHPPANNTQPNNWQFLGTACHEDQQQSHQLKVTQYGVEAMLMVSSAEGEMTNLGEQEGRCPASLRTSQQELAQGVVIYAQGRPKKFKLARHIELGKIQRGHERSRQKVKDAEALK